MGFNPALDYQGIKYSATNPAPNYACGTVEYGKFQYEGVQAKREIVLTHNGVVLVMDRIRTDGKYTGKHSAGVIYQVWPGLQQEDPKTRWLVQSPHAGTAVTKDGAEKNEFSTLFCFPSVGTATNTAIRTDPKSPSAKFSRAFCAWTVLEKNSVVNILSLIIPLQDSAKAAELIGSITVTEKEGSYGVRIPCVPEDIRVLFSPHQEPKCGCL